MQVEFKRKETEDIYNWINKDFEEKDSKIALLVGNAGYGKSVVLKDLLDMLNINKIPNLGIKVDKLLNINSTKDIESELNIQNGIYLTLSSLCSTNQVVVFIIDQIDALSQSLSSSRHAINSYDRLIKQLETLKNIRIIISCRTYDLDYDPTLKSYKEKEIIRLSLLSDEDVKFVLEDFKIKISEQNNRLKEFLRIPLHLNLFCKVGLNKNFDDTINLQKLYDEIWNEFITKTNDNIQTNRVSELLTLIAQKMNAQQHIVVDKRYFDTYNKEFAYLLHNDILKENDINKIQFAHQTLFDYVYARTFISSGKSITEWLKEIHQGLFIRSQVKQIFSYLRDLDSKIYIQELYKVLFGSFRFP